MAARESIHGQWSSRWMFVLAATGSAVGLGNIWRFPYEVGENGGGAFVLVYLVCILLVGVPLLMAEVLLGRRGRQSPINSMRTLAHEEGLNAFWQGLGGMGVTAGFLILSFYSVVAGWGLSYAFQVASGAFEGATASIALDKFDEITGSASQLLIWHSIFMVMCTAVVAGGVKNGLEQALTYLMPTLFLMLLVMVCYGMFKGNFTDAVRYLFSPDFSKITEQTLLDALSHAFFTLSLGMGAIMVYGSYLPAATSIPRTTVIIAACDTLVAILAGLAIFPIVFAYGLPPDKGPGLVFTSLTIAFGHMTGGQFFGTLFFALLTVAAWTSAISLLEPIVSWLVERFGIGRATAAVLAASITWLFGIGSLLSFNLWSDYKVFDLNFFGMVDLISSKLMLPLGGLLIAIFAGWRMARSSTMEELNLSGTSYLLWLLLVRFVSPVAVILIMLDFFNFFEWLSAIRSA